MNSYLLISKKCPGARRKLATFSHSSGALKGKMKQATYIPNDIRVLPGCSSLGFLSPNPVSIRVLGGKPGGLALPGRAWGLRGTCSGSLLSSADRL